MRKCKRRSLWFVGRWFYCLFCTAQSTSVMMQLITNFWSYQCWWETAYVILSCVLGGCLIPVQTSPIIINLDILSSFSIKMDNHQTLTDSLLGPQDREPSGSQIPGPVTIQPTETAFSAQKSDSFPCLQPLSLHQQAQGEVHESGEDVVVVKQKTANGSSVIFLVEVWLVWNAVVLFTLTLSLILCKSATNLKCLPPQKVLLLRQAIVMWEKDGHYIKGLFALLMLVDNGPAINYCTGLTAEAFCIPESNSELFREHFMSGLMEPVHNCSVSVASCK